MSSFLFALIFAFHNYFWEKLKLWANNSSVTGALVLKQEEPRDHKLSYMPWLLLFADNHLSHYICKLIVTPCMLNSKETEIVQLFAGLFMCKVSVWFKLLILSFLPKECISSANSRKILLSVFYLPKDHSSSTNTSKILLSLALFLLGWILQLWCSIKWASQLDTNPPLVASHDSHA